MNLSPDNSLFAVSGGPVGEIRRTRDLSLVTTLPTLPKQFQAFAFSPDNRLVAMANESGAVRLFDLQHDRLQRSFVGRSSILDVAFLPDGKRLASINWYGEVKVWNMESRLPMETFFDSPAGAGVIRDLKGNLFLDFKSYVTRDGKTLVSQSKDGTVESRNLATGEVSRRNVDKQEGKPTLATAGEQTNSVFLRFQDCSVAKLDANGLKEELRTQVFTGGDMRFKVLPGGRRLLAYLFGEGHQRDNCAILDTQSLKVISRFRWKDMPDLMSPLFLGSSKDASLVAFGTGGTRLSLFTTANGKLVHVLNLYGQLRTLAFSPDGAEIAISTDNPSDSASGRIELFDTHTGKKSSVIDSVSVHRMAYSPTRRQLVGAGPAGLMLFDLKKKQKIAAQYLGVAMIQQFALSPDGERIITNGRLSSEITFWDARTLSELMSLTYTPSVPYGQAIQYNLDRCRFSPDGRDVVAFCTDGAVRIWHSLPWKDQPKAVRK